MMSYDIILLHLTLATLSYKPETLPLTAPPYSIPSLHIPSYPYTSYPISSYSILYLPIPSLSYSILGRYGEGPRDRNTGPPSSRGREIPHCDVRDTEPPSALSSAERSEAEENITRRSVVSVAFSISSLTSLHFGYVSLIHRLRVTCTCPNDILKIFTKNNKDHLVDLSYF